MRPRSVILALSAAALTLAAGRGFAQAHEPAPRSVAVERLLPLRVWSSSKGLSPRECSALTDSLAETLRHHPGFAVLPVPKQDPMDLMVEAGCTDLDIECLVAIGSGMGADLLLFVEVEEKSGKFRVQARLAEVARKGMRAAVSETESRAQVREAIAGAVEEVLGPGPWG